MRLSEAKKIAEIATNIDLSMMLKNAMAGIDDWRQPSICNKGMSKGVAWNILAKNFDITKDYDKFIKSKLIREFGEFLPNHLKPIKKVKPSIQVFHQDPIFNEINNQE